jgi:hypothetical protein
LRTTVATIALVYSAAGAQATAFDWGVHVLAPAQETALAVGGGTVAPGSFLDTYLFSLPVTGSQQSSVAVAINLSDFNISNGAYSLFSTTDYAAGSFSDDVQVGGSWSFSGTTGSTVNTVTNLQSGYYYFRVSGLGGIGGGQYLLNSSVVTAPIPEPETYALMLAGLSVLGVVARRKKKLLLERAA